MAATATATATEIDADFENSAATMGSPAGPPGNYVITVTGASSPNYAITFANGTLTVDPARATVEIVQIEKLKKGKKSTEVIVVQFSEAMNSADAMMLKNYSLVTVPRNKKQKSKAAALAKATYDPATFTVTLRTAERVNLHHTYHLTLVGTGPNGIRNTQGELLDGADSGTADSDYSGTLTWRNVVLTPAEAKKIAGMAETYYAQIAPHLYAGPVEAAANIHFATSLPNFLILESIETFGGFYAKLLKKPIRWEQGYVIPPAEPGLGIELNEEVALAHPYTGDKLHLEMTNHPVNV